MMKRKRLSALYRTEQRYGYLMISPVVLGFCVLLVFPLLYELYMSLTDMQLNGVGDFVGLQNYVNLFNDPKYINSMKNTVVFAIGVVPVNVLLAIIANVVLKGVGYNVVIFLSAMMSVPESYYEAAELDGAGSVTKFINITLPMISPTTFMVIIMTIIGAFKSFANIYNLTKGGPARTTQIIILYIYQNAFREYKFGYAAAASVVLFVIILLLTVTQWAMRRRMVYAED